MSLVFAIIGYGKMGREIEQVALQRGHRIGRVVEAQDDLAALDLSTCQVAIECTMPHAAVGNVTQLAAKRISTVVVTTGWYDHLAAVEAIVRQSGIGLLWSANFSIGVQAFWKMLQRIGPIMNRLPEYDVLGHEFHHAQKKDSPSGTALKTAEILLQTIDRKETVVTERLDRALEPNELHFSSTRGGSVPGTHSVYFDSPADTIELRHTARSRAGFAAGAVQAAEWLQGRKGFFSMSDFLEESLFDNL